MEAIAGILKGAEKPLGSEWRPGGDDLCDCTFQLVYEATNPYIGKTQRVRVCCILAKVQEMFPEFVTLLDGWHDVGRQTLVETPLDWDNDTMAMPPRLWYRALAAKTGRPLADIRAEYSERIAERPGPGNRTTYEPASLAEMWEARETELRATGWRV